MAKLKYVSAASVFSCCGKYLALTKEAKNTGETVKCPSCGATLTIGQQVPKITIIQK